MSDIEETRPPSKRRPTGLGRGLSALLGEVAREEPVAANDGRSPGVRLVAVADIKPHPEQPRRHFDEEALAELAKSIAARGLIQPIVVRPFGEGFQIVAGERRWRAAQRAQLHHVPVIVRDFDEAETLEIALVENIQREDLNAIEEADAYRKLIDRFGHSQEALARLVHKSRSHIANLMRLLDLPSFVRGAVTDGRLSMGQARALVTAADPEALARTVIERGLSVRETERLARDAKGGAPAQPKRKGAIEYKSLDSDVAALERQLGDLLGLKVKIAHSKKGGTVSLGYSTLDQLDMICQRLTGEPI
ncbi:MAG: chromosome partitioning protein ParB [Sphingomonas sp. SCN 67-18]|uniref:ParB/RepB/Spo0J family partition protein n=1 Tax=uncultured Sphingomonas sp. TaxID=158754 RepID=UPI000868FAE3|nr:ParB/RepB/Spo0J family partition protein [Sphingomonas sp. SCN 67-18]ODU22273.1 MAG: chromosome partitioning protein ParB [Sphingomonas sp. SCN 67-18]